MRQTLSRGVFAAAAATGILSLYGTPALADSFAGGGAEDSPGVLSGNNVQAPVHVPVNACGNTITAVGAFNGAYDNACVNGGGSSPRGDSGGARAEGGTQDSPGVLSGNNVQAPVHVPVNACGNGVNGAAALNEASGSTCANTSGHDATSEDRSPHAHEESSHADSGGAHAVGGAQGSPGLLSGNTVQVPLHVPVNACGDTVDVLAVFNEASDSLCVNDSGHGGKEEPGEETPEPPAKVRTPPAPGHEEPPAEEERERPGNPPHLAETGSEGLISASAAGAVLITGGAMLYRRGRLGARR
ncbi:chaplin [Streptomyces sp. NPDC016640]|uniref:chaplin n=1 Tax=Streptomyces sp. NPDC016640 TaxID=3364969 RepID=UPI0036F8A5A1